MTRHDASAGKRKACLQHRTLATPLIDDREHARRASIEELIVHEVHAPPLMPRGRVLAPVRDGAPWPSAAAPACAPAVPRAGTAAARASCSRASPRAGATCECDCSQTAAAPSRARGFASAGRSDRARCFSCTRPLEKTPRADTPDTRAIWNVSRIQAARARRRVGVTGFFGSSPSGCAYRA